MDNLTHKKLLNMFLVNISRRLSLQRAWGYPYLMMIDPCNTCILNCPLCVRQLRRADIKEGLFPFSRYKELLEKFGPYLTHLQLYNWGEPFLHKEIYEMVRLAKQYDIFVTISTNLNVGDPEKIVDSGLDSLICSLDGATQEIYEKYRVKGNLEAALNRAREIVRLKKERNTATPRLIWQYLLFQHNQDELAKAREMADEIGFDNFFSSPAQVWEEHPEIKSIDGRLTSNVKGSIKKSSQITEEQKKAVTGGSFLARSDDACAWLYSSLVLDPSANVFPCCVLWKEPQSFGKIDGKRTDLLFNSDRFRSARRHFASARKEKIRKCVYCDSFDHTREENHCEVCSLFAETYLVDSNSLRAYFRERIKLPKVVEKLFEYVLR